MQRDANSYRYTNIEKYAEILGAFYKTEMLRRIANLTAINDSQSTHVPRVLEFLSIREHIVDWMVDWCWTFDPRNPAIGLPSHIPWIPWPRQIEFIEWFYDRYLNQQSGLVEKSRDAGATWLFCLVFLREWRWEAGFAGGIGSRKLSLVDDKENPKAIFVKLRILLENQPYWWYPDGWVDKCDKVANLINPENNANIAGEGGDDIGRGDRRSVYFIDESAYLEHPGMVDSALSQTTNSQFDLSTPNGQNHFGQKRHSGKVDVFTFHWKHDDRKTAEWYEDQKATLDDVIVAQEIDIDYHASVEGLFIPPEHVKAAIELELPTFGAKSAGLDVAAGGANLSSLAILEGCCVRVETKNFKNGSDLAHWAIEKCNRIGVHYMNYDKIGVGHAVYSTIERTEMQINFEKYDVDAGTRASDAIYPEFSRKGCDIFINARAEWWYIVARRFKNTYEHVTAGVQHSPAEMISIENDGELIAQLSSPKKFHTDKGKIKVESKEQMLKRQIKSPDKADSLIMAVIPQNAGVYSVWPYYNSNNRKKYTVDWKKVNPQDIDVYGVLYLDTNNSICGNFFFWNKHKKLLRVYSEIIHHNPISETLVHSLIEHAQIPLKKNNHYSVAVKEIFGNDKMFVFGKDDIVNKLLKVGVRLKQNKSYDEPAAILQTNRMFQSNQILVNTLMAETDRQYRTWTVENEKPANGYALCRALCIIINVLREKGDLNIEPEIDAYTPHKRRIIEHLQNLDFDQKPRMGGKSPSKDFDDYLAK